MTFKIQLKINRSQGNLAGHHTVVVSTQNWQLNDRPPKVLAFEGLTLPNSA